MNNIIPTRKHVSTIPGAKGNDLNAECAMRNETSIIKIKDEIGFTDDIHPLLGIVKDSFKAGITKVAISFTPNSYLDTNAISVLVQCFEMLNDKGGRLAIIAPNEGIMEMLRVIGIEPRVDIYKLETDILG